MIPCNNMTVQTGSAADSELDAAAPTTPTAPRLWLVDDNTEFRSLLAALLADEGGFDCSRKFSSVKALCDALLNETPPDAILLDIELGEESGLDALLEIKSLAGATHVIMLTTFFDSRRRKEALANGATSFLLKSYSIEQIAREVRRALEQPVPCATVFKEVSPEPMEPRATESANGRFSNHDLLRTVRTAWARVSSGLARKAVMIRSLLALLF